VRDTSCQYCGADGLTYVEETPAAKILKYELEVASLKKTVSGLRVLLEASERTTAKQARHIRELEQVLVGKLLKEHKEG